MQKPSSIFEGWGTALVNLTKTVISKTLKTGNMPKKDIANREDIERLVDAFYERVKGNKDIGFIFSDIVKVDWAHHLPRMYAFWASLLLGELSYGGNPMQQHIALSLRAPLGDREFAVWLRLFTETVDALYEGIKAEEAKQKAENLAQLMRYKIKASQ